MKAIEDGVFQGFIVADIRTPRYLIDKLDIFPPIFACHNVTGEMWCDSMHNHAIDMNIKKNTRRLLLSGFAANELLINAPLARYYRKLGLEITRIHQAIEFPVRDCFSDFVSTITKHRLEASKNPKRKIVGEIYKLLGNVM